MKINKFRAPDTFLIIFFLLIITAAFSWFIPAGEYEREEVNGRKVIVTDSYTFTEKNPQGLDDILMSPIKGFIDASLIIGFVLIVGGAFGVFQKTKAVDAAIMSIAKAHGKSKLVEKFLIPGLMIMFSFAGGSFGMSEEVIPFILVFVPLALMLGYDSITGVAIPFIGAGAGFAGAFLNPFTIGIAQGISGLNIFSGIEYRLVCWALITASAIFFVNRYAKKIKAHPEKSVMYNIDLEKRKNINLSQLADFTSLSKTHKLVLATFLTGLIVLIVGVLQYSWYIEELSAVFVSLGIAVGLVGRLKIKEISASFVQGAKDLAATALVIALARGILILAQDGKIIDTILFYLSQPISNLHPVVSSQAMFIVQTMINFFVPSGSGQAVLTMPVMAPLADLVNVSRQTAVLAFQFGDGFSNLIIPTSAVTMSVLTLAEISWEKWARWIFPLMIIFFIVGLLLLIPPVLTGWK